MSVSADSWLSRRVLLAAPAAVAAGAVRLPRKVRVAVWGLDGHAREYTKPLAAYPDVEIAAVQHHDLAAAEKYAQGKARVFSDPRRMLDETRPDIVGVCNDNGNRARAVIECLRRGIHVVAEKPLALSSGDLDKIRRELKRSGAKLGMLLPMRWERPYQALKKIVDCGDIGEVIQISAQKSYVLGQRPGWMRDSATFGSTILWIGIHMIDLMRWTSSREFRAVSGFQGIAGDLRQGAMETTTSSSFRLDNGGAASLHMDYCRPATAGSHGDDRLRLAGTRGVAEYMAATGVTLLTAASKPRKIVELPPAGSLFAEFLDHVYLGKPTTLPHNEIFRVCELTLAAHEAARTGKVLAV